MTSGRRTASPEQKKRLQDEFKLLLVRTYAGALTQVKDQTVQLKPRPNVLVGFPHQFKGEQRYKNHGHNQQDIGDVAFKYFINPFHSRMCLFQCR